MKYIHHAASDARKSLLDVEAFHLLRSPPWSTRGEKEGAEGLAGIEASRARAADERSARRRNKKRHGDVRDSQRTLLKLRVFLLQKVFSEHQRAKEVQVFVRVYI